MINDLLSILNNKALLTLDISGIRLDPAPAKSFIKRSKWDLDDNKLDYKLEVSYSSKEFSSYYVDQLQILHLNRVNFDKVYFFN